jgi:hypothetical protein
MDLEQDQQKDLIGTTDCLEAIGVFKGWKNFFFIVVVLCLLLSQASFWLVSTGLIVTEEQLGDKTSAAAISEPVQVADDAAKTKGNIKKAAKEVVATPNEPNVTAQQQLQGKLAKLHLRVEFKHIAWLIRIVNFVLIIAAILYCLTMLFSLKISLLGKLGGINHISRAFFLSLVFLVLLLPWQIPWRRFFAGELLGAIYTAEDLLISFTALKDSGIFYKVFYYLRFTGYWLIVLLPLIFSYVRSCRWAKATLRRLEVI